MDVQILLIGVLCIVVGLMMMIRSKFYKYKTSDMLFAAKLNTFIPSAFLVLLGILCLGHELKKLFL